MDGRQEGFVRPFEFLPVHSEDFMELVGPGDPVFRDIPLPAADMGLLLRLGQHSVDLAQLQRSQADPILELVPGLLKGFNGLAAFGARSSQAESRQSHDPHKHLQPHEALVKVVALEGP